MMLKIININDALRLKGFTCLAVLFSFAFDREKMLSTVKLRRRRQNQRATIWITLFARRSEM